MPVAIPQLPYRQRPDGSARCYTGNGGVREAAVGEVSERVQEALRKLRQKRGMSLEIVAERLGLANKSSVSRKESGSQGIDLEQLEAWAALLDANVEILIYEAGDRTHETLVTLAEGLGPDDLGVIRELAATLPHMPEPAKRSLRAQFREWRSAR